MATLILAGGLALGAYQAGALERLLDDPRLALEAVAGSSIGAIQAAILAGNPPERRIDRLRHLWQLVGSDLAATRWTDPLGLSARGMMRHGRNWASVAATRLAGVRGLFRARGPAPASEVPSLYDHGLAAETLTGLIDFDRLNACEVRCCIAATDLETAETIWFDTARGDRVGVEHLLASGSLLPNFPPIRIGDRLLADGGFSANAPLEPLLCSDVAVPPRLCVLIDLFAADAPPPTTLEAATGRSTDLQFAAQTLLRLRALQRERAILGGAGSDLLHLSYRPLPDEAAPEKQFDFSRSTLDDRWRQGARDAAAALRLLDGIEARGAPGLRIHKVEASPS